MAASHRDRAIFGAAALAHDSAARRAARRADRRALVKATLAVVLVGGAAMFGAGMLAADSAEVDRWRDAMRARALFEETAELVAALPLDELARLGGQSIVTDGSPVEGAAFRVELDVSDVPDGLRIHAILIDNRTREALKDFVAFRGRS